MWVRCWGEVEEGECFVTVDRQSEAVVAKVSGTVWHSRQMHALPWLNQSFQPDDSFSIRTRGHQSPIYIGWELWVKENIGGRMMNLYKGWMLSNWFRSLVSGVVFSQMFGWTKRTAEVKEKEKEKENEFSDTRINDTNCDINDLYSNNCKRWQDLKSEC